MKLQQAREAYKNSNINFEQLETLFFSEATEKEKQEFWKAPVFDRPGIIEGKNKTERDQEWNGLIS